MNRLKLALLISISVIGRMGQAQELFDALVFSKTNGFRHESIAAGIKAIKDIGVSYNFNTIFSEDSTFFSQGNLDTIEVVVFLNTTGDILNDEQQQVLEDFVNAGGGFVGIHSATDTEYNWPWYGELIGCYFQGHPKIQEAELNIVNPEHLSTRSLPKSWTRTDEWYNFKNPLPDGFTILLTLNEASYEGGTMGDLHPISWFKEMAKGRMFYTEQGHTTESYHEANFLNHIIGGIFWAAGEEARPAR
jgi:type 1 glutamine amidotransferase